MTELMIFLFSYFFKTLSIIKSLYSFTFLFEKVLKLFNYQGTEVAATLRKCFQLLIQL
jgi:hypothetical protein